MTWLDFVFVQSVFVFVGRPSPWDDAPEDGDAPKPTLAKKGEFAVGGGGGGGANDKKGGKAGRGAFKRRRDYDDLDEDIDRGKVSKHVRRKTEGVKPSKRTGGGGGGGKSRNAFQSAAKLKQER